MFIFFLLALSIIFLLCLFWPYMLARLSHFWPLIFIILIPHLDKQFHSTLTTSLTPHIFQSIWLDIPILLARNTKFHFFTCSTIENCFSCPAFPTQAHLCQGDKPKVTDPWLEDLHELSFLLQPLKCKIFISHKCVICLFHKVLCFYMRCHKIIWQKTDIFLRSCYLIMSTILNYSFSFSPCWDWNKP